MQIAVLGYKRPLREEVEQHIRSCLAPGSEVEIRLYGLDEPIHNPAPPDTVAAFVIVDGAKALHSLRSVARWGEHLPVVIVSDHPQYALEGIRVHVRDYLLFPLTERDTHKALRGVGVEVRPNGNGSRF